MDEKNLRAIIEQVLAEMNVSADVDKVAEACASTSAQVESGEIPDITTIDIRKQYLVKNPEHGEEYAELKAAAPCRLGIGKAGARYNTLPQLEFNLSHSGRLALCGLDCQPLGVDIQIIKAWRPALPRRVCSEAELRWLEEQPDPTTGFSLLWSLKEARVKESGQGLRMPIREISVPLPPSWEAPVRLDALWFFTYQDTGWTAAVCGHTPPPPQIQWRSLNF